MNYVYYNPENGRVIEIYGETQWQNSPYPFIEATNEKVTEYFSKGYNAVDLVTFELKYVDFRTDEEKEADRRAALVPKVETQEKTKREMETMNLLVELGKEQITYSEPWLKRYTILMASSLITILDVPELLRTEVQRRFEHWFD